VVLPRHVLPAEPQSGRCLYGSAPSTVGASGADQSNHNVHRRSITINMCNSKFKSLRCSLRSASSSFQVPHRSQHGNNKGRTRGGPPPHGVPVHVLNKSVNKMKLVAFKSIVNEITTTPSGWIPQSPNHKIPKSPVPPPSRKDSRRTKNSQTNATSDTRHKREIPAAHIVAALDSRISKLDPRRGRPRRSSPCRPLRC
jgi:hypothetical protein